MEYSIGSVADLISGSTTPNKAKVIEKQFKMKAKTEAVEERGIENSPNKKAKKKLNRKRSSDHMEKHVSNEEEFNENIEEPVIKLKKKRTSSPKIIQDNPDANESDTSDDEELNQNSKKKKQKAQKVIKKPTPTNPDHVTIFVGNLPISFTHQKLQKLFSKFGNVVNARIRSIPVADLKIPKKVAAIKKQFHPDRKSVHGYVTFASQADAENALSLNGQELRNHHLRVNICDEKQNPDKNKAIFLGNVSFTAEEEELWKLFESCGEIESVRLIRDRHTNIGKGFGYINFKSADSVVLALQMGEVKLRGRDLRISLYNGKAPKKVNSQMPNKNKNSNHQKKGPLRTTAAKGEFQGKFATDKKKKFHKGNQQRKNLAKKIAPKTMPA